MNKKIFILLSLVFTYVFTLGLNTGEFLFLSDQFFPFNLKEIQDSSLSLLGSANLGYISSWQSIVQFLDSLFFLTLYKFNIGFIFAEKIHYFITFLITFSAAYFGLSKLGKLYSFELSRYKVFLVSFFYCFNPYTLALWHGGVYNIGSALTYSLAPLIIYYIHVSVLTKSSVRTKIICALILFLASFVFWLFAVICYVLILYILFNIILNKRKDFRLYAKNLLGLVIIYLPLASIIIFNILYKYINIEGSRDPLAQPGFGNQQGGLFYQFKFLFSWGIYTVWSPRTLYFFGDHFFSWKYNLGVFLLYVFIFVGFVLNFWPNLLKRISSQQFIEKLLDFPSKVGLIPIYIFSSIYLISLFFAKANQPPFGEVFVFLYKYLPLFSVFRNADIRFGFAIILSLTILALAASRFVKKVPLALILIPITLFLGWNLINGSAVKGLTVVKKGNQYIDRVVSIPVEYKEVSDLLNGMPQDTSYVYSTPSFQYSHLNLGEEDIYIGQDILSKLIKHQFVFTSSDSSNITTLANEELQKVILEKDFESIRKFPIKYILYRKDVVCSDCEQISNEELIQAYNLIDENKLVSLYEIPDSSPVIDVPDVTFKKINATKYIVDFKNVSDTKDLKFLQSYNSKWKIYLNKNNSIDCLDFVKYASTSECVVPNSSLDFRDVKFLFSKSIFEESHSTLYGYANSWEVSPEFIKENFDESYYFMNDDGSLDFQLTVYYKDQSWYLISLSITLISLIACGVIYKVKKSEIL